MQNRQRTLSEACSELFLFLTTFRRNAKTSTTTVPELRANLQGRLDHLRRSCEGDAHLGSLIGRAWYALVVAADQLVLTSEWRHRVEWSMNLLEMHYFQTMEGGVKFYTLADEIERDPSDAAAEIAELLFNCMALGFQGQLLGNRPELENRRQRLFEKARLAGTIGESLTPTAYGRNSSQKVTRLPAMGTLKMVLIGLGALVFSYLLGPMLVAAKNQETVDQVDGVVVEIEDGKLKADAPEED